VAYFTYSILTSEDIDDFIVLFCFVLFCSVLLFPPFIVILQRYFLYHKVIIVIDVMFDH